ncbi:hypothetical protein GXP70_04055 [Paenibacillus lycopersici]|uniref:Uncharacterized protein n=1 Tax=Paenibacillus lycopersici TaxID=2704462 RepID=A0A6C0FV00_9BACL|nr:hypothetical protein [Paenibacillus lycopersici]QHT59223.1 hypothetical protein GXP70_04055 [Paenibacillus lycopersici]
MRTDAMDAMHAEEERGERPSTAGLRARKKASPLAIVLVLAVIAAIIVTSFALAHVLIDAAFRKLAD